MSSAPSTLAPTTRSLASEVVDASLLSFIAAFVDTACFVGLFGLFTAHVTGNFVLIGAAVVQHNGAVVAKLLALPVFALAVLLTAEFARWLRARGAARVAPILCLEAMLLLAAMAVATFMAEPLHADAPTTIASGMLAVAAMGLQNALMRIELAALPPTTVMTGNVTQVLIDVMAIRSVDRGDATAALAQPDARHRIARMWPGIVAFTLGAACGAAGYAALRFWCLCFPALLCFWLAWRLQRPRRQAQ